MEGQVQRKVQAARFRGAGSGTPDPLVAPSLAG